MASRLGKRAWSSCSDRCRGSGGRRDLAGGPDGRAALAARARVDADRDQRIQPLPLAALDGGKVLQITLFARNLLLEVAFLVLAALGLVAYSLRETTNPVLWYGSIVLLVSMP